VSARHADRDLLWLQLGFGAGLRAEHYEDILAGAGGADWFEAISENYMDTRGRPLAILEAVRHDHPIALHGVSLSIGSIDDLDLDYLSSLRRLIDRIDPSIVSDHLCWSGHAGRPLFDLLPLPYTEECLEHVTGRVSAVQEILGRRILLENPSTYLGFAHSTIPEAEFLASLAERDDCGGLLDVNNVHVSSVNLDFDPYAYIAAIPAQRVGQIHLAGFTDMGTYLFDTHSRPVSEEMWDLYAHSLRVLGSFSTMVEWDDDIPAWERLVEDIDIDLTDLPERVLVRRVGDSVETRSLDPLEALAVERLLDDARLGEVMTDLSERGARPQRVSDLFAGWLTQGLVSSCLID